MCFPLCILLPPTGTDVQTKEEVAVKLERAEGRHLQLRHEYDVLRKLNSHLTNPASVGVPTVHLFATEGEFNAMVLDLLGPSLEDLFNFCGHKFSVKTVLMLADQLLRRIELVHNSSMLHRDIKPNNFLMGVDAASDRVYIIDFGLSKKYRDERTHAHVPYKKNKNLTGTARYASVNAHCGIQSRRDDIESLGFMMMYFVRGSLPWQGLRAKTKKAKYQKIYDCKRATAIDELCKGQPVEFQTYLRYCRALRFEDRPDYNYLRKLFRDLYVRLGYQDDAVYDWTMKKAAAAAAAGAPASPNAVHVGQAAPAGA